MIVEVEISGRRRTVDIRRTAGGFTVILDGRPVAANIARVGRRWSLLIGLQEDPAGVADPLQSFEIAIDERSGGTLVVYVDGQPVQISSVWSGFGRGRSRPGGARDGSAGTAGPQRILAPMPGKIVKVLVKPGDAVALRQGLIVVEAMKMENELRSPKAGTVAEVRVVEGASVEAGAVLAVVE